MERPYRVTVTFRVVSLRRYPVKSMGGESLDSVSVNDRGVVGDRWFAVVDGDGYLASGKNSRRFRRRDAVFDYSASTDPSGAVTVRRGDRTWAVASRALDAELSGAMDARVHVLREQAVPHQDAGAVSLVGTASLDWRRRHWGINADPRRLRVNIVVETIEPFIDDSWIGRVLDLGDARLRICEQIPRCRMVDINQDSATAEGRWLKHLGAERELCLAVYADVARPGTIQTVVRAELQS